MNNIPHALDFLEMMRKEDINYLIKEIVEAESKFYDKHGYFSYWSPSMKLQRIKELKEARQKDEI